MTSAATITNSLRLDPPTFTIDEEEDDDNIELWSFRLPVAFPLQALKGLELPITTTTTNGGGLPATKISVDGQEYRVELGDAEDTESFRVLIPQKGKNRNGGDLDGSDGNGSSTEEDDEGMNNNKDSRMLVPSKRIFTKHFSILSDVLHMTESQLAPREGPTPKDKMRHAYSHVPQRTGLKRRWMPLGVDHEPTIVETAAEPIALSKHKATKPSTHNSTSTTKGKTKQQKAPLSSSEVVVEGGRDETSTPSQKRLKKEEEKDENDTSTDDDDEKNEKLSKSERKAKKAEKKAAKKAKKEAKKAKKASKKVKKES